MSARERVGGAIAVVAAIAGHAAARTAPDIVTGPVLVLDHLYGLLLVASLLATCVAVGTRVLRGIGMVMDSAIETLAFGLAIGSAVLSTGILLVSAMAGVRGWVLAGILVGAVLIARRELGAIPALLDAAWNEWRARAGSVAAIVIALIAIGMLLLALAPPVDTDSLNYHLRVPAQFLDRGRIHLPDDNLHVAWVGLAHFLYLPLLAAGAAAAPAVMNVVIALLLAAVICTAAERVGPAGSGRMAPLLLWGSPIVLLVAITPKIDVTFAFHLFLAHYALVRAFVSPERRWMHLSAVLCGFAVGIKLLALPYIASLSPIILVAAMSSPRREGLRRLAAFAGIATLAALPWLLKNWLLVGAPFYPELSRPIMPPWVASLHGSSAFPAGLDPASLAPLREVRVRFNILDWFVAPARLTPESEGRFYHANPLFALVLLAIPMLRQRAVAAFLVPAVLYVAMAMALGTRINLRYLVPVIPALTLVTAWVIATLLARVRQPRLRRAALALVAVVALVGPARALAHKYERRSALAHATGLVSRLDYRLTARDVEVAPYAWLTERVNALVPADARILLLFEPRGYAFRAGTLQDNLMTNWVLLEPAVAPPRCLESSGITHVLVGTGTLDYFIARGFDPRIIHWDRFPSFAARCLVLVDQGPGATLYAVRPGGR